MSRNFLALILLFAVAPLVTFSKLVVHIVHWTHVNDLPNDPSSGVTHVNDITFYCLGLQVDYSTPDTRYRPNPGSKSNDRIRVLLALLVIFPWPVAKFVGIIYLVRWLHLIGWHPVLRPLSELPRHSPWLDGSIGLLGSVVASELRVGVFDSSSSRITGLSAYCQENVCYSD